MKIVQSGTSARNRLIKGADHVANLVKSTLGPFGQNVFLEKGRKVTNDGVTIAREVELQDEIENMGASVLREASIKTNDEVGDGTTSSITLAQAILKEGIKYLPDEEKSRMGKMTPSQLIKKIELERQEITSQLEDSAVQIKTEEDLINSAIVSVEDKELGVLIGQTQWKLGKNGVIIAEETAEKECSVEFVKGIKIDNGFGTSMIMNNQEKQCLEIENTFVLLSNYVFTSLIPITNLISQLNKLNKDINLVIMGRAFSSDAIRTCMENIKSSRIKMYPINAPYTDQNEIMKDMVATLGGTYCHDESVSLEDISVSDLGWADRVVARRYDAIFTSKGDESRISERVKQLEEALNGSNSEFEKKNLNMRIAQLTKGFAILKVGSYSDIERKRLKDKAEDAVNAVRVAFQGGTVKGAGLAFKEIAESLPNDYILKKPIQEIYNQIYASAPEDFVIEDWVRDPMLVLKVALKNACSVAASFATANGAIVTERIKPRYVQEVNAPQGEDVEHNFQHS